MPGNNVERRQKWASGRIKESPWRMTCVSVKGEKSFESRAKQLPSSSLANQSSMSPQTGRSNGVWKSTLMYHPPMPALQARSSSLHLVSSSPTKGYRVARRERGFTLRLHHLGESQGFFFYNLLLQSNYVLFQFFPKIFFFYFC